ncbi:hypothetical protein [Pseudoduganella sp.]|uniref:hypothetical protein n=1 Tax=Pseudoduganella sp. TaxID=1880898 RepID=UPI0035B47900
MPARIINWWLTISASDGASLRVEIKKRDARIFGEFFLKRESYNRPNFKGLAGPMRPNFIQRALLQ